MAIVWHIGKTVLKTASILGLILFGIYIISPDAFAWLMYSLGEAVKVAISEFGKGMR